VCKEADIRPGIITITLQRGGATFVLKEVAAQVCPNCGEEYVDAKVTAQVLLSTERLARVRAGGREVP
jgi:YgiT-type zinc finger domain-containing protein